MKNRLLFLCGLFLLSTLALMLFKLPFLVLYLPLGAQYGTATWLEVICHGLSLDMTVAGYITALPLLFVLLSLWLPMPASFWRTLLRSYLTLLALVVAAIYALDLGLYGYWGFRVDSSVLLYLKSPEEAAASLTLKDWMLGIAAFTLFATLLIVLFRRWVNRFVFNPLMMRTRLWGTPVVLLLGGLCFLAIRGGVTVAVANVSKAYFSADQRQNHAAVNPLFSFLSSLGDEKDMKPQYLFFEEKERAARFEELRGDRADTTFVEPLLTTLRPNVVIILLESFSRNFVEATSEGVPVMPYLSGLKEESIWFENCYANSYRTDRGQVAVLNGYPAQTKMSIMKYPAKSHTLPSLARTLGEAGYSTWFTYGGDLNFTDQASYMYATGWQRLTWQKDLDFAAPTSKWGYADDVMADYFGSEVLRLDAQSRQEGHPFLAGWLTLSSHEPFEVPFAKFSDKVLNAMAFTDACVGEMLARWRASSAWENLLVVLVADHGYPWPEGTTYNSPARHRIPMLWTGGAVRAPRVVESYCAQSDLAATLLHQLELGHEDFLFSRNILSSTTPKFGYWCFNDGFGVINERGVVLYDATSDRWMEGSDTTLLHWGKLLLQTTYKDIRTR